MDNSTPVPILHALYQLRPGKESVFSTDEGVPGVMRVDQIDNPEPSWVIVNPANTAIDQGTVFGHRVSLSWFMETFERVPAPVEAPTNADGLRECPFCGSDGKVAGPLNAERWTLDQLIAELHKWKDVMSGATCVSFENLCCGASSLWHQTHRENFRKIDRKPADLSRWVLHNVGGVKQDFPAQVLSVLQSQTAKIAQLESPWIPASTPPEFECYVWAQWKDGSLSLWNFDTEASTASVLGELYAYQIIPRPLAGALFVDKEQK